MRPCGPGPNPARDRKAERGVLCPSDAAEVAKRRREGKGDFGFAAAVAKVGDRHGAIIVAQRVQRPLARARAHAARRAPQVGVARGRNELHLKVRFWVNAELSEGAVIGAAEADAVVHVHAVGGGQRDVHGSAARRPD